MIGILQLSEWSMAQILRSYCVMAKMELSDSIDCQKQVGPN